jgi:hypothetical protein
VFGASAFNARLQGRSQEFLMGCGQNGPKRGEAEGVVSPRNVIFPLMEGFEPLKKPLATPLRDNKKFELFSLCLV